MTKIEVFEKLLAALRAQHTWHCNQTDEDEFGMIPANEYSESSLCEETISAIHLAETQIERLNRIRRSIRNET